MVKNRVSQRCQVSKVLVPHTPKGNTKTRGVGLVAVAWDPAPHIRGPGFRSSDPASCYCSLRGSRRWLNYSSSCHPSGRPSWCSSWLLASAVAVVWGVKQHRALWLSSEGGTGQNALVPVWEGDSEMLSHGRLLGRYGGEGRWLRYPLLFSFFKNLF